MNNKNYQPIIYSLILILGIYLGKFLINDVTISKNSKLESIIHLIEKNYVDGFDILEHEDKILTSIMKQLDPHSGYLPKKEQSYVEDEMSGSFSGVGIEFNILKDSLVVVTPISGGPSEKLGILSGDRIVEVDGEDFASVGLTNSMVIEKLRGEKGSEVNIKIYRRGESNLLEYTIQRGDIPLYSVDASYMINEDIGYLKVNRFSATTNEEFFDASEELLSSGMKKMILDLRSNPGGYLGSAIYMCNEFLDNGELIVYTEGKYRKREEIFSDYNGRLKNIELVVLINEGSASASEIVSGCVQDLDRGIIVGNRSFGKGLVQEEIKLNDGSAVRITTQRYFIPSGRSIQKPYDMSDKEYNTEMYTRTNQKDEDIPDSLKYTTKNGRIVYGGGGVTPDSIIKIDSSLNYSVFNMLRSKNLITEFCLKEQNSFQNISDNKAIDENILFDKFVLFLNSKNSDFDISMGDKELSDLKNYIKASLVRNLSGKDAYFRVLSEKDDYIQKAIEILK